MRRLEIDVNRGGAGTGPEGERGTWHNRRLQSIVIV